MAVGSGILSQGALPSLVRREYTRRESGILGGLGLLLFAAIWEMVGRLGLIDPVILSSPSRIAVTFVEAWQSGELPSDLLVSLKEFAVGFVLAAMVGMAVGVIMGLNVNVEYSLDPFVWFFYSAPLVAFYPLFVVWIGFGFWTVVAITFLLTAIPITVNTLAGVQSVDVTLVRVVRSFGGSTMDVVSKVIMPASVPLVLAGIRMGLGRALIGVVVGELFSGNAGLGYRMGFYGARLQTTKVFVPLVVVVILGVIFTQALRLIETRWLASKQPALDANA